VIVSVSVSGGVIVVSSGGVSGVPVVSSELSTPFTVMGSETLNPRKENTISLVVSVITVGE
jgi:hypothetical protein